MGYKIMKKLLLFILLVNCSTIPVPLRANVPSFMRETQAASGLYKQSLTIVDSYRVELRAIELAIASSGAGIDFKEASKLVTTIEQKD